ncbi:hypothetical protein Tco_0158307 [Tanacetum coccineum]
MERLGGHDEVSSPSAHPKKKHNEETSANLVHDKPGKYSGEVGVSKDTSGLKSQGELRRSWVRRGELWRSQADPDIHKD